MTNSNTSPATTPRVFNHEEVNEAITAADRAVSREAMTRTNPHDFHHIRAQIHAVALIVRLGEPMFHKLLMAHAQSKDADPLIFSGFSMMAEKLKIQLTKEERAAIDAATSSVSKAKLLAPYQPDDLAVNMRALQQRVTPHHTRLDAECIVSTKHNENDYYDRLCKEGFSEMDAHLMASQFSLTLSRIGQSLVRYDPKHNNGVDFFNTVVDRVLAYNARRRPTNSTADLEKTENLQNYVYAWRDEVKHDFMGVDAEKIAHVKATIHEVAQEVLSPKQKRTCQGPNTTPTQPYVSPEAGSFSRHFRSFGEGTECQRLLTAGSFKSSLTVLNCLAENYSERHDPAKITLYLQAFMASDGYRELSGRDSESVRRLDIAIEQICQRLGAELPNALKSRNSRRADKGQTPDTVEYWQKVQETRQAETAAKKAGGIS